MEFVCSDPGVLQGIYAVKSILQIVFIIAPIILVVRISIDIFKEVINNGENLGKTIKESSMRFIALAIMFLFIPLYSGILEFASVNTAAYSDCLKNSNPETIAILEQSTSLLDAITAVSYAERSYSKSDYDEANYLVEGLSDSDKKSDLQKRLQSVLIQINKMANQEEYYWIIPSNEVLNSVGEVSASKSTNTTYDPMASVIYNEELGNPVKASNFTYMSDVNGDDLGVWPINYNEIPMSVSVEKTYPASTSYNGKSFSSSAVGEFIWPLNLEEPQTWSGSYEHNGIDIIDHFGTPIYAPVSGTLIYSEYGHTKNDGADENPYSMKIKLNETITIDGINVSYIFLTHFSGLMYNCADESDCSREIKQGELIGFTGNAAGSADELGWAPHLHMTFCSSVACSSGVTTADIKDMYQINAGESRGAGK